MRKLAFTALIVLLTTSLRAADDPFVGLWKVNLARSKYQAPPPQLITFQYEPAGHGWLKVTNTTVDSKGNRNVHDRVETYDGKAHPIQGEPGGLVDSLYLKRLDAYTLVGGSKKDGLLNKTLRWEVSKDGKTFTWTATRVNPPELKGKKVIQVFDRQ